jgi:excisionase family DNA binding protein
MGTERFSYKEAAQALGISTDAVRMRVRRGTLPSERDETGVKVILNADQVRPDPDDTNDLVSVLQQQLAEEREARRRADHIILQLSQANATLASRVPALPAANDERRDVNASHDDPVGGYSDTGSSRENPQNQSSWGWFRRLFR